MWSPDGTRIAFTARVPDEAYEEEDDKKRAPRRFTRLLFKLDNVGWTGDRRRHVYVVPADGSAEAEQLTDGDYRGQPSRLDARREPDRLRVGARAETGISTCSPTSTPCRPTAASPSG